MKTEYYDLNGSTISIPIAESYKDCIKLVKSDIYRLTGRMESTFSILIRILKPFSNTVTFWLSMSSYRGGEFYPLCKFMYKRACLKANIDIPSTTKIGYGLYTGHNMCIVVNGGTIIGNNVNLSQFLNIGTNHSTPAIIGDNVYIGPHVCIVENVKIGNNASIGAGAVVTKDIPANSTAAGVPAKILNYNNPGKYINRRYPIG